MLISNSRRQSRSLVKPESSETKSSRNFKTHKHHRPRRPARSPETCTARALVSGTGKTFTPHFHFEVSMKWPYDPFHADPPTVFQINCRLGPAGFRQLRGSERFSCSGCGTGRHAGLRRAD